MRAVLTLALALISSGCGGAQTTTEGAGDESVRPRLRVLGAGPRALLGQLHLPASGRFSLPTSSCQDVLAYVRSGSVELDGGRVLLPGRAIRFGPGGAAFENPSSRPAELYLAVTRSVARRFGPDARSDMQLAPEDAACGSSETAATVSDTETTGPFENAGGELLASVLLDEANQRAVHGSLVRLEGSADVAVPEHEHEVSAEMVFVEAGEGRMRVGDQNVAVRPGTFVYIPPGTPHAFTPSGNSAMRVMQLYMPAGPEQRYRPRDESEEAAPSASGDGTWGAGDGDTAADAAEGPEPSDAAEEADSAESAEGASAADDASGVVGAQ